MGAKDMTSAEEMIRFIHGSQIGQSIDIVYVRNNNRTTVTVIPIESPPPK
jgi:PDZ domain-containing secreted protein